MSRAKNLILCENPPGYCTNKLSRPICLMRSLVICWITSLIIEAIDDYDVTGAVGMERALNAVLGTIITDSARAENVRKSQFGEKFWIVVTKVGVVLKLAKTATELAEGVRKLLISP